VQVPRTANNSRHDETNPYGRRGSTPYATEKLYTDSEYGGLSYRLMMNMAGEENLTRPYAQHPWVHACVAAIARAVSSVPLQLQKKKAGGEYEPVESGPLYELLMMPNALMSQRKWLESISQTQKLYGETFLIMMVKENGLVRPISPAERLRVPDELWPVRGDLIEEVIDDRSMLPRAWRMATKQGQVEIDARSVVQIADANPYNPLRGMGPMQAAYRTAAKDFVLDRYDEALLANGGSPGGVLSVDGHLTDADSRAISRAWREAHERPDAHHKTAVLPQGTSYEQIGFSPSEMEFGDMRAWNRETIMSIFGVTKPIIGLTEGLNYASAQQAFRTFWEVTITPFLDFLADELQTKFVRRLTGPDSEYWLGFDTSGVSALREDEESKLDRLLKLFKEGGRTFAEAAHLAGMDIGDTELVHADTAYMSTSMAPVGTAPEETEDDAVPPTEDGPEEEPEEDYDEEDEYEEDEEDEDDMGGPIEEAVDQDVLDEVYASWRSVVNMGAAELRRWAETECSRKASVNPRAVIDRNLRLLETKKGDWDGTHIRAANRAISFISRMRGMPKGEPVTEGCPSKRDISLKNWAFDPNKGKKSYEHLFPTMDQAHRYLEEWDNEVRRGEERIAKAAKRVLRDMVLAMRKKVREVAINPSGLPRPKAGISKAYYTEAEIQRLLDINYQEWSADFVDAMNPGLTRQILAGAEGLSLELGGGAFLTATDPAVLQYLASKELVLANVAPNLRDEIQRAMVGILSDAQSPYGSLREALWYTMKEQEAMFTTKLMNIGTRAELIARTETTGAANYGRQQQMAREGVATNIWLAQPSARPEHLELDGKEVPIGEEFGYNLRWPGDQQAGPGMVCNCRCVLLPGQRARQTEESDD
jgi:HK97 family phage portal protein